MAEYAMSVRVDQWLWAARFFKTRSLSSQSIKGGHVSLNGVRAKPAKEVKKGDVLILKKGLEIFELTVLALAEKRGSTTLAQGLYQESERSIQARETVREQQRNHAASSPAPKKRPDKKSRRHIIQFKQSF
ncbi:MAG: S4 domain-containing protein [Mariprofundaceae bacterium]|nr:S4 domain-containing protein [Mariprofundaceae bacterium]